MVGKDRSARMLCAVVQGDHMTENKIRTSKFTKNKPSNFHIYMNF